MDLHQRNMTSVDESRQRFVHIKKLDSTTYKRSRSLPEPFQGLWRQRTVEWMYAIVHFCDLRLEAASAAAQILDASVSKGLVHTPADYQLVAMTSFLISLKIFDSPSKRVVKLSSLIRLGNGEFNENDVIEMEKKILFAMEWRMNAPTSNCFLYQYLLLLPKDIDVQTASIIEEGSSKAIEAAVCREVFAWMDSSILAYAAMLVTIEDMDQRYQITPDQLSQFVSIMTEVTKLDGNSHTVARYTLLLNRLMRNLPITPCCGTEFSSNLCEPSEQHNLGELGPVDDSQSPHYVVKTI